MLGYQRLKPSWQPFTSFVRRPVMHASHFDTLTVAWSSLPRRRLLGGLTTGGLSTLLGLGGREASAESCRRSRNCPSGQKCVHRTCSAKCVDGIPFTCDFGDTGAGCQSGCFCGKKPGGGSICVQSGGICAGVVGCKKQGDCPSGQICTTACCGDGDPKFTCLPPCTL